MPAPSPLLVIACLSLLTALLFAICMGDILHRRIPNRLSGATALLALPWWAAVSPHPLQQLAQQALIMAVAAAPLLGLFAARIYGGGDVKLIAALLLWVPAERVAIYVAGTAVAGSLVAIMMLAMAKIARRTPPTIPYGVAIAIGAALALFVPAREILMRTGF